MHTRGYLHDYGQLRVPLLALAAMALGTQAQAQFGFALSPMRVELSAAPGSQRTGTLAIGNADVEPGRFRTEILDVALDKEAVPQFETNIASEAEFSCKNWVTVNPMEADVEGQRQMPVRYTFRVPAAVPPRTYHCALGFTTVPNPKKHDAPIGIVSLLRLTSTFYITVGNVEPMGEMKRIAIEKIADPGKTSYRAVFNVENSGLTNLRGAGTVEIVNDRGEAVQTGEFPPVVILPKRSQRIPLPLSPALKDGNYILRAHVNLGTGEIQEAEFGFRLPIKD
jgi:hypothetical protein